MYPTNIHLKQTVKRITTKFKTSPRISRGDLKKDISS